MIDIFEASASQWSSLGQTHREMSEAGLEVRMIDLTPLRTTMVSIFESESKTLLIYREFAKHEIFSCEQWCLQQLNAYRSWK